MTAFSPNRGRTAAVRPPVASSAAQADAFFVDETEAGKRDGTVVMAAWFNAVAGVLRKAIRDGGVTLDDNDDTMLSHAISAIALGVAGNGFLPLIGGTLTGPLTLAGDAAAPLSPVTLQQLQGVIAGLKPKGSARLATAAALPANVRTGNVLDASANGVLTVDGTVVALNDLVLVKNEATAAYNGLYQVTAAGGVSAKWQLTRAASMASWAQVPGAFLAVEIGTANADTGWVCTSDQGGTLGTTAITWSAFFGPGMFQAASALLTAIAGIGSDGLIARTAAGAAAARSVAVSGGGISVSNGDGVAGNPTLSLAAILASLGGVANAAGVLTSDGTNFSFQPSIGMRAPDLWVRCELARNTNDTPANLTAGAYITRTLNTVKRNVIAGASLASNQITLPAGTYYVRWRAPALGAGASGISYRTRSKLYNVTASADIERTSVAGNYGASTAGDLTNTGEAYFTLGVTSVIEVRHLSGTGAGTPQTGSVINTAGEIEIYSSAEIWKVA